MKARFLLLAWFTALTSVLLALPAYAAYIDPSVVSYAAQAVAGVVIAGSAVFIVWWRRFRSKVSKKLGIDENAGKEVEEDIIINDEVPGTSDIRDDAGCSACDAVPDTEEKTVSDAEGKTVADTEEKPVSDTEEKPTADMEEQPTADTEEKTGPATNVQ